MLIIYQNIMNAWPECLSVIFSLKKLFVDAVNDHWIQYANTESDEKLMLRENL